MLGLKLNVEFDFLKFLGFDSNNGRLTKWHTRFYMTLQPSNSNQDSYWNSSYY